MSIIRMLLVSSEIEDLCNGSTPDSDSVCGGSNPSTTGKKETTPLGVVSFFPFDGDSNRLILFLNKTASFY